jgi:hypothetical protein
MPGAWQAARSGMLIAGLGAAFSLWMVWDLNVLSREIGAAARAHLAPDHFLRVDVGVRAMQLATAGPCAGAILVVGTILLLFGLGVHWTTRGRYPADAKPHWTVWPLAPMLAWMLAVPLSAGFIVCLILFYPLTDALASSAIADAEQSIDRRRTEAEYRARKQQEAAEEAAEANRKAQCRCEALAQQLKGPDAKIRERAFDELRAMNSTLLGRLPEPTKDKVCEGLKKLGLDTMFPDDRLRGMYSIGRSLGSSYYIAIDVYYREHRGDSLAPDSDEALREAIRAVITRKPQTLLTLLERGLPPNGETKNHETLLTTAAKFNNLPAIDSLLDHGADINQPGYQGDTALHLAAESNRVDLLTHLLARGGNVDVLSVAYHPGNINQGHGTPLMYAVQHGSLETASLLLDKHANPNIIARSGRTALDMLRQSNNSRRAAMERLLLAHGAKTAAELKRE